MDLISVECPSCGARLPPKQPCGSYQCEYCNGQFNLEQAKKAQTEAGVMVDPKALAKAILDAQHAQRTELPYIAAPTPTPVQPNPAAARRGCGLASVITLITLAGVLIPLFFTVRSVTRAVGVEFDALEKVTERVNQTVNDVTKSAGLERVLWDDVGGPPQVAQIGDEVVIIGRTRAVGNADALYCSVYNTDGKLRWRTESLGTYSAAYRNISCTVAGDGLIASDGEAGVRLYGLTDGTQRVRHGLTDLVERVCVPPAEDGATPTRAWVLQIDERASFMDLATGELSDSTKKPPEGCANKRSRHRDEGKQLAQDLDAGVRLGASRDAPKLDGAKVDMVLLAGDDRALAFGHTSPGTKVPYAAVYSTEGKTKDILWQSPTPSVAKTQVRKSDAYATIVGDKVVTSYGAAQEDWMLTAFDLSSGARIWETKLRPIFAVDKVDGIVPAKTHVLVLRTSSLEIFDASTGALTGTIGNETYDD